MRGLIEGLGKKKATSEDGVLNECLRWVEDILGEWWCKILNECVMKGVFPKVWKRANVIWVPKAGGEGVRSISLLPVLGKVLDKLIAG